MRAVACLLLLGCGVLGHAPAPGGESTPEESSITPVTFGHGEGPNVTLDVPAPDVNQPPVAAAGTGATWQGLMLFINFEHLLAASSDPDGDALSFVAAPGMTPLGGLHYGYFPPDSYRTLNYGESAQTTLEYVIEDSFAAAATGTVTVTIYGLDDGPMAEDDAIAITESQQSVFVDVLSNDTDIDSGQPRIRLTNNMWSAASVPVIFTSTGVTYAPSGMFDYLGAGESTSDWFFYFIEDDHLADAGIVFVDVTGENDLPVANDDHVTMTAFQYVDIALLANDSDVDLHDTLHVVEVSDAPCGTTVMLHDNLLRFDPQGQTGTFVLNYSVRDQHVTTPPQQASVYVTVNPGQPAGISHFAVSPTGPVAANRTVTLSWSSTDASSCTLEANTIPIADAPSGSRRHQVTDDTTFVLSCFNSAGDTQATRIVSVGAPAYFVDDDTSGTGTGLSWEEAFNTLDAALVAAGTGPVEIRIKHGVYRASAWQAIVLPMQVGNRYHGGYPQAATGQADMDVSERTGTTTLDGDSDGNGFPSGSDSHHVVTLANDTLLSDVVITRGWAKGSRLNALGAGALGDHVSNVVLERVTFVSNRAVPVLSTWSAGGGGLALLAASGATISQCTFEQNVAISEDAYIGTVPPTAAYGGALLVQDSVAVAVTGCTFTDNMAQGGGPGVWLHDPALRGGDGLGGALAWLRSAGSVSQSTFAGNWAFGAIGGTGRDGWPFSLSPAFQLERATGATGGRGGDARGGAIFISGATGPDPVLLSGLVIDNGGLLGGNGGQGGNALVGSTGDGGRGGDGGTACGAAVAAEMTTLTLASSVLSSLTAQGGMGGAPGAPSGSGNFGVGGSGGSAFGGGLCLNASSAIVIDTQVSGSSVSAGAAGPSGVSGIATGGGIVRLNGATLTLQGATAVSGNAPNDLATMPSP